MNKKTILKVIFSVFLILNLSSIKTEAANPPPQSGSIGLEGTISSAPPTKGPTIVIPTNGTVFTSIPITVSGLCPSNLLIKIFDNNVFVGSTLCTNNSFSLQIDLFSGQNVLIARDYDSLDQAGPDSNIVTVTFNNTQNLKSGIQLTLSSIYAERGAPPGTELDWPIIINGGTSPYALSIDWGDGTSPDLISTNSPGTIIIKHKYRIAGVYKITIKATDKNNESAFLQLVGQATGAIQSNKANGGNIIIQKQILWWPILAMIPLLGVSFWAGVSYKTDSIQKQKNRFR
ncbi:MAG TPA: hypothetical protein VLF63_01805 [Patescibacteria group bacterium]|nr:hypothetical protein [Patescibacteria group bacterium]